ncbi:MAG: DUF1080 domain-containing protein [Clostridiaceae bacterium]|nr:DUF1080 domain-containing protein [Clostridiaceae bacterium]
MSKKVISVFLVLALVMGLVIPIVPASFAFAQEQANEDMLLWYKFDETTGTTVTDYSGRGNHGTLVGGTSFVEGKTGNAVQLNGSNGYVDLPDGLLQNVDDVTITTWVNWRGTGSFFQRLFDFGNDSNSYMFITPNADHPSDKGLLFAITLNSYQNEQRISRGTVSNMQANTWKHVAFVKSGNTGILYLDGVEYARNDNMTLKPSDLGYTTQNYIGKSQFSADPYFNGMIDDFRIYNRAFTQSEITDIMAEALSDQEAVALVKSTLVLDKTNEVVDDIVLPQSHIKGVNITWQSSNPAVISNEGKVTRPARGEGDATVQLTAIISKGEVSDTKQFTITVLEEGAAHYTLNINAGQEGVEISPNLIGLFFEDINYGADGGLYAEMVENRSFEFATATKNDRTYSWSLVTRGNGQGSFKVINTSPLNSNNPYYAQLTVTAAGEGVGIANDGFQGLAVGKGERYNYSLYARSENFEGPLVISLEKANGTVYAQDEINGLTGEWKKFEGTLESNATDPNARLVVKAMGEGIIDLDMISLFPERTWNYRSNGLRYDLVKILKDMKPKFLRFPGGCIVEGKDLANAYRWKDTIGDVAERKMNWNRWQDAVTPNAPYYYQSYGLGFHEYFLLCEDIGAEPVPVVNCGMACQYQTGELVPMNQMDQWVQDALDLIEYANGDVTTTWGAKRAANGHPEPFNLKYLAIGNEQWGEEYFKRYKLFYDAIKEKYPEIKLISTSGPSASGSNFEYAWKQLRTVQTADLVDEHYYMSPEWFLTNVSRYDNYDRSGPKVFVGEYAAHGSGRRNNLQGALAEAAFMTGLERNGDIVELASYAPLFAKENATQWTPDMIWFNNTDVYGSPTYYVQKMFSRNMGDVTIPTEVIKRGETSFKIKGSICLGTWQTQVEYDDVKVVSKDGEVLFEDDFSGNSSKWTTSNGTWQVQNGVFRQTSSSTDCRAYVNIDGSNWTDYTITLRARKTGGAEGMLIGFGVQDANNYYWWNLGGWSNTRTTIEKAVNGTKTAMVPDDYETIKTNEWYDIKIEVSGNRARCYLNGRLVHDMVDNNIKGPMYAVASKDNSNGDIIVKVVNTSDSNQVTKLVFNDINYINPAGIVTVLTSENVTDENSFANPTKVVPVTNIVTGFGTTFEYEFLKNSLTILRLSTKEGPIPVLESAVISSDSTIVKPGSATWLTVEEGNMSDGSKNDLGDAVVEYYTSDPTIATVDSRGKLLIADEVGEATSVKVWADVSLYGQKIKTNELTIQIDNDGGEEPEEQFNISTSFNMDVLEANKTLIANIDVTNINSRKDSVLAIVALYDDQNRMVNFSYISKKINIGQSVSLKAGFKLPKDVTGHKVQAFVWEGTSLVDTSMRPISNVVELQ